MAKGIMVKVWNVTANAGERSGTAQVKSSIDYIEDMEKVAVKLDINPSEQMKNELNYIVNDIKTVEGLYIGGRHILDYYHATNEMVQVKEFFGKMDGRVAVHGVISLDEEESDEQNAGKLMLLLDEVMEKVFPEHQVVYAVHTNTENLHVHFVINTVGLNGKKIHMDKDFVKGMLQPVVNEMAVKYGFTPNEKWTPEHVPEHIPLPQRKRLLRAFIDNAVEQTDDFASFVAYLRADGLAVNIGKSITLQMEGMAHAMRTGQLGSDYTVEGICRRLSSKSDPIVWKEIGKHSHYLSEKEMMYFTPNKMKRYRDMKPEEREHALRLIRLKRNPWEEARDSNWQLQRMSKQLNEVGFVYELVHFYSGGSDCAQDALDEIVRRRKEIAIERKEIKENLKKHRGIVNIYDEMKKYMQGAYLYEAGGMTEYIEDYRVYMELVNRLEIIYGKNVQEVSDFVAGQRDQLVYARRQDQELNGQYKIIAQYIEKGRFRVNEEALSFFKAVGHGEAKRNARDYGILASDIKYISAQGKEDIIVRVVTTPDVIGGKATIATTITVFDKKDNILTEISSRTMDARAFNDAIFDLAVEYGLKDCQVYKKNIRGNLL